MRRLLLSLSLYIKNYASQIISVNKLLSLKQELIKMTIKLFVCALLLLLGAVVHARHIHPNDHANVHDEIILEEMNNAETDQAIDVLNLKPTRFVPMNNVLFFKTYEPCEDGFIRDVLGICREVWD